MAFDLAADLRADAAQFEASLKRGEKALENLGKAAKDVNKILADTQKAMAFENKGGGGSASIAEREARKAAGAIKKAAKESLDAEDKDHRDAVASMMRERKKAADFAAQMARLQSSVVIAEIKHESAAMKDHRDAVASMIRERKKAADFAAQMARLQSSVVIAEAKHESAAIQRLAGDIRELSARRQENAKAWQRASAARVQFNRQMQSLDFGLEIAQVKLLGAQLSALGTAKKTVAQRAAELSDRLQLVNIDMFGVLSHTGAMLNEFARLGPSMAIIAGAGFGIGAALSVAGESIMKAAKSEHEMATLRTTILGLGKDVSQAEAVVNSFAGSMVSVGTAAEAVKLLSIGGLGLKQTVDLLKSAEKFALQTGQAVQTVFDEIIAGATKGEVERFVNIGLPIKLDDAMKAYERLTGRQKEHFTELDRLLAVTTALQNKFTEATKNYVQPAETLITKIARQTIAYEKLQQAIGAGEGPLGRAAAIWTDFTTALFEWLTPASQAEEQIRRINKLIGADQGIQQGIAAGPAAFPLLQQKTGTEVPRAFGKGKGLVEENVQDFINRRLRDKKTKDEIFNEIADMQFSGKLQHGTIGEVSRLFRNIETPITDVAKGGKKTPSEIKADAEKGLTHRLNLISAGDVDEPTKIRRQIAEKERAVQAAGTTGIDKADLLREIEVDKERRKTAVAQERRARTKAAKKSEAARLREGLREATSASQTRSANLKAAIASKLGVAKTQGGFTGEIKAIDELFGQGIMTIPPDVARQLGVQRSKAVAGRQRARVTAAERQFGVDVGAIGRRTGMAEFRARLTPPGGVVDERTQLDQILAIRKKGIEEEYQRRLELSDAIAQDDGEKSMKLLLLLNEAEDFKRDSLDELLDHEEKERLRIANEVGKRQLDTALEAAKVAGSAALEAAKVAGSVFAQAIRGKGVGLGAGLGIGASVASIVPGGQAVGVGLGIVSELVGAFEDRMTEEQRIAREFAAAAEAQKEAAEQQRQAARLNYEISTRESITRAVETRKGLDKEIAAAKDRLAAEQGTMTEAEAKRREIEREFAGRTEGVVKEAGSSGVLVDAARKGPRTAQSLTDRLKAGGFYGPDGNLILSGGPINLGEAAGVLPPKPTDVGFVTGRGDVLGTTVPTPAPIAPLEMNNWAVLGEGLAGVGRGISDYLKAGAAKVEQAADVAAGPGMAGELTKAEAAGENVDKLNELKAVLLNILAVQMAKGSQDDPLVIIPKDRSGFSFAPRSFFFRSRSAAADLGSNMAGRTRGRGEVYAP